jgi:hypothetical protein
MNKYILLHVFTLSILFCNIFSQTELRLKENNTNNHFQGLNSYSLKNSSGASLPNAVIFIGIAAILINPMLVIEDKKVYFGLTKEISFWKYPYGRLAFEYSFIFRTENKNHFRFSYNYDIVVGAGDFIGFLATPGAGYFTDTKNHGWFLQGAFTVLLPVPDIGLLPYLRYRHTFVADKQPGKTDIDDISLGVGICLYF